MKRKLIIILLAIVSIGGICLARRGQAPMPAFSTRIPEINEPPIWRDPSIPIQARAYDLIRRMSVAEKAMQLNQNAPAIERLGLPAYDYWSEALHGVANNGIATVFPQAIGMGATWDTDLIHQEATVIGIEGRAKYNDTASQNNGDTARFQGLTFWSPNINIVRDPRWGRGQETYGEDPFLTGTLGVAFIKGLQGDDPNYMLAMACAKHYAVHSGPEPERNRFNAEPSERDLYETYLPHFEMAVREGKVGGIMGAYSAVDGVPCCANTFLLTEILRKRWGFDGYIVSDCGAIRNIWAPQDHHYVATAAEAAAVAVKAGCNLCCDGDYRNLADAIQKGLITEEEIDLALYYTLWTRFRLGLLDPPQLCKYSTITIKDNDTPEHRQLALQVARESIVLLKNDGLLPLNRSKVKKIAVFGANATNETMLRGNYNGTPSKSVTILDGIRQLAGDKIEVTYAQGCPLSTESGRGRFGRGFGRQPATPPRPLNELRTEANSVAAKADILIYVGGINGQFEGEGFDRASIELPQVQEEFIRTLHKTGKPVILINCSGSAMAIPWEAKNLPAILQAWYPGEEGGRAVGEILFGDVNPSGHLPVTFYASMADLPDFRDYSMSNRTYRYFNGKPLYAFGHGLSYTKFAFQDGKLDSKKIPANGTIKLTFTVKNTGKLDGDEVAQVYFRHVKSRVPQAKLALCSFTRMQLKRGESKTITLEIPAERLRYWDTDKKQYVVESGAYEFLVGAASDDISLKLPVTITEL